jgi:hypothetical protein
METQSPYDEEDRWAGEKMTSEQELEIALIRERLLRCNAFELHHLLWRINKLLDALPNIPMTEEQRGNARRLTNGFRSLFVVERRTPSPSA